MDELGNKLIEQAGPVGAALGVVILTAGAVLARAKGWFGLSSQPAPKQTKPEANGDVMSELRSINARLGSFDARIKEVEHDLASRPTRQDVHRIEMSMVRMDERMAALSKTVETTGIGVTRIENILLAISGKGT